MLFQIPALLRPQECAAIADAVSEPSLWKDGKITAKGGARAVKNNLQADPAAATVKGAVLKLQHAIMENAVFRAAAQPARIPRIMINRYSPGMGYGDHVDAPYIENARCDLSFTIFLTDPSSYVGGALVINNAGHEDAIRGEQGSVVLYPSTAVHRVEAVTCGERLACVGWVKSRIQSGEHRAIVFDLESVLADMAAISAPQALRNKLANIRNNLLRTFGD